MCPVATVVVTAREGRQARRLLLGFWKRPKVKVKVKISLLQAMEAHRVARG
jgi:hypothetical protein